MPILTQSMEAWLEQPEAPPYFDWCKTEKGRQYLKGGSKYDPKHMGNIAADRFRAALREV